MIVPSFRLIFLSAWFGRPIVAAFAVVSLTREHSPSAFRVNRKRAGDRNRNMLMANVADAALRAVCCDEAFDTSVGRHILFSPLTDLWWDVHGQGFQLTGQVSQAAYCCLSNGSQDLLDELQAHRISKPEHAHGRNGILQF
jgi:hypothetical protein